MDDWKERFAMFTKGDSSLGSANWRVGSDTVLLFILGLLEEAKIDHELLVKAHEILSSDGAAESDSVALDILDGKKVSQREQIMAEMITTLYKLIHPYMGCENPHEDWKREFENK